MNDLPAIGYNAMRKELWDCQGQTMLVARRKCMAKSCSTSKKRDFGKRSTLFSHSLIANGLWECRYSIYVSNCLNNREICDKIYR